MRLLVTRPEPDGERSAARLRALGHDVAVAPALRTKTVAATFAGGPFAAVVITSANAARALANHARRGELIALPLFAVGARSADAAREAGFSAVVSADGDADDLVDLLAARFSGTAARLIYLAGEDRTGDLAGRLAPHGIAVETAVIYRAVRNGEFPRQLGAALAAGPLGGVLHYSRRSVEAFLAGAREAGLLQGALAATQFCLSAEVAAPLEGAGAVKLRTAARPDEASLIALLSPG